MDRGGSSSPSGKVSGGSPPPGLLKRRSSFREIALAPGFANVLLHALDERAKGDAGLLIGDRWSFGHLLPRGDQPPSQSAAGLR